MKKIISIVALCFCLASLAQASPGSPASPVLEAYLNHLSIDPNHGSIADSSGGMVSVDTMAKTVNLTVLKQCSCEPDMACAQALDITLDVTLPLITVQTDNCGTVKYEAIENNISSGGNFEAIYVFDNTKNTCPHFVALPETEVRYVTIVPTQGTNTQSATSTFTGGRLMPGVSNP